MIGNRKSAALEGIGRKFALACLRGQFVNGSRQPLQILLIGIANNWHDQALIQRNGHPNMNAAIEQDASITETAVDLWHCTQRGRGRGYKIGRVGQVDAFAGKAVFIRLSVLNDGRHIDFKNRNNVRAGLFTLHHVLRDSAAHRCQRRQNFI